MYGSSKAELEAEAEHEATAEAKLEACHSANGHSANGPLCAVHLHARPAAGRPLNKIRGSCMQQSSSDLSSRETLVNT